MKNPEYLEQLHQTIGDLLARMNTYSSNLANKQELAQLYSQYVQLDFNPATSLNLTEETIHMLELMCSRLLTIMENVLYTI